MVLSSSFVFACFGCASLPSSSSFAFSSSFASSSSFYSSSHSSVSPLAHPLGSYRASNCGQVAGLASVVLLVSILPGLGSILPAFARFFCLSKSDSFPYCPCCLLDASSSRSARNHPRPYVNAELAPLLLQSILVAEPRVERRW